MKYLTFLFFLTSLYEISSQKCCDICVNDTEKYYSIPLTHKTNCGESCLNPDDYKKYKIFEPALTKANTPYPCNKKGFITFLDTEIHSIGSIQVELDLFSKP